MAFRHATQICYTNTHTDTQAKTHPLPNAVVWTIIDDLHFLPENTVPAPASDLGAGLDCKHQQDDEGNKYQESKDNGDGLQEAQGSTLVG